MAANIMWAWVMTVPATATVAWITFTVLHWIGGV
jgi:phosphate/sulfate permease